MNFKIKERDNMHPLKMFRKLSQIAKFKTGLFITSAVLIIFASFFEIFGITLIIPIINTLTQGGDFLSNLKIPYVGDFLKKLPHQSPLAMFISLLLLILGSTFISNFLLIASSFCASKFFTEATHSLRVKIFSKYLSFEKTFYDKSRLGTLISIMIDNTKDLGMVFFAMRTFLVNGIMATAFLIFLFMISWKSTLLSLPLIFFIYYPLEWLVKKLRASAKKQVLTSADLNAHSMDILSNIILVKSYTNEEVERDKFINKSKLVKFHTFNVHKKDSAIPRLTEMIATSGFMVLVFIFVVFHEKAGTFSVGRFLVYFLILMRFINNVKPVNELKGTIAKAIPIMEKIYSVFDYTDKPYVKNGNINLIDLKDKVEFKNLNFRYLVEKPILKNINFVIKKERITAIVGPTGSGKTTIANLLCRFYDYDSGFIEIDGVDIRNFTSRSLREHIAIVTQDTMLLNDTIRNNIVYGTKRKITQEELDDVAKKAYLYNFIKGLPEAYETYVGDRGIRLSGGEKQRISIARTILKNADILILDEATSALDSETERLIQNALENLMRQKTVLAIAHRLSTIKNADWIVVLEEGVITEQGPIEELLNKKGKFFYYWNLQKFY